MRCPVLSPPLPSPPPSFFFLHPSTPSAEFFFPFLSSIESLSNLTLTILVLLATVIHETAQYIPPSPGLVLTPTGEIFDQHQGLHSYTIGQKFPKAGLKEGEGKWFVVAKEREANRLIVAQGRFVPSPLPLPPSFSSFPAPHVLSLEHLRKFKS